MSSLRSTRTLLRQTFKWGRQGARPLSGKAASGTYRAARPLILGAVTAGVVGYGSSKLYKWGGSQDVVAILQPFKVSAAGKPKSQPSVVSQTKDHALFLWIHIKPNASPEEMAIVARVAANLPTFVEQVVDIKNGDGHDEIVAGVGFGPNFWSKVSGKTGQNFDYIARKGEFGAFPNTGGDVFIHAKSDKISKLFDLAQNFLRAMPDGTVDKVEDIYGFVYENGRDLSGFIDGTENPKSEFHREQVAVEKETGGSYVITQKWIHDLELISKTKVSLLEQWIGRRRSDSREIKDKSPSSHVARITGGNAYHQKKMFEIVRQSLPFGTVSGEAGLFFIAYSASPDNFNFMLDRMVGASDDHLSDEVMLMTRNVKGTFWYFPGVEELEKLA